MQKQKVVELLEQLHIELSAQSELDEEMVSKLRQAVEEIETTLSQPHASGSQSLVQRLQEAVYHLPDSHPVLKNTVGRIADALSQIGI